MTQIFPTFENAISKLDFHITMDPQGYPGCQMIGKILWLPLCRYPRWPKCPNPRYETNQNLKHDQFVRVDFAKMAKKTEIRLFGKEPEP